jgi:hypothetical protein
MYASLTAHSEFRPTAQVNFDGDDHRLKLHLTNMLYCSFSKEEWDMLVAAVNQAIMYPGTEVLLFPDHPDNQED